MRFYQNLPIIPVAMPPLFSRSALWLLMLLLGATRSFGENGEPLLLKTAPSFDTALPGATADNQRAVFLRAETLTTVGQDETLAEGHAEVIRRGLHVNADRIHYQAQENLMEATGNVHLVKEKSIVVDTPHAIYNLDYHLGYADTPAFRYSGTLPMTRNAHGNADLMEFTGDNLEHLSQAVISTCSGGRNDWYLRSREMDLDHNTQEGLAKNATVNFFEVPILYSPVFSFPLDNQRRSGFLAPTYRTSTNTGQDIATPYYFNIAPNFDDTFTPRLMSLRGVQAGNEFRYLQPGFRGILQGEYLAHDNLTGSNRWELSLKHSQQLLPGLALSLNAQQVSDPNYMNDLSTLLVPTAVSQLPHDANLAYTGLPGWNMNLHYLSYQNLTGATPQFRVAPQLTANWNKLNWKGLDFDFRSEYSSFISPGPNALGTSMTALNGTAYNTSNWQSVASGNRLVANPSVTLPLRASYGYALFKTGIHYTQYDLVDPASPLYGNLGSPLSSQTHYTRTLPVTSVDAGLVFERDQEAFGRTITQTLEPRLYYLYAPYRNQAGFPVFDAGVKTISDVSIFSENLFSGSDRISNGSALTAGLTSRLLDPKSGAEILNAMVGHRFNLVDNIVTLPGNTISTVSPLLASLNITLRQNWKLYSLIGYNPTDPHTQQLMFNSYYKQAPGKVINFGYRNDVLNQVRQWDISSEWALSQEWALLGRAAYSTLNDKVVEGLMGVEYNRGCWAVRTVATRYQVSSIQSVNSFFLQLELGSFGLGQNPIESLRRNIPGYMKTNEIIQ
jgi:LPS-assembly protein